MVLIAESVRLQQLLATYGIQTQTPHQIEPIQIWPPVELAKAYEQLGVNDKLGLSGRPPRPIGGLGTAKVRFLIVLNHYFMSYFVFLPYFEYIFHCLSVSVCYFPCLGFAVA